MYNIFIANTYIYNSRRLIKAIEIIILNYGGGEWIVDSLLMLIIGSICCNEFLRKAEKENPNTHPIFIFPTVGKDMGSFRTNITATSPSIFVLYGYS